MGNLRLGMVGFVAAVCCFGCSDDDTKKNPSTEMNGMAGASPAAMGTSGSPAVPMSTDPTKVTLSSGMLEGDVMGDSVRFLNIPYAKPPVGDLRWKAPQTPDK